MRSENGESGGLVLTRKPGQSVFIHEGETVLEVQVSRVNRKVVSLEVRHADGVGHDVLPLGESIKYETTTVTLVEVRGNQVRLRFISPPSALLRRGELSLEDAQKTRKRHD